MTEALPLQADLLVRTSSIMLGAGARLDQEGASVRKAAKVAAGWGRPRYGVT
jgi:hypothetical protein